MNYAERRSAIVAWVCDQLIGPWAADQPLRQDAPLHRYPVGVLSPLGGDLGVDPADEAESDALGGVDPEGVVARDQGEPTQARRRFVPPSSVGFSFFIQGPVIQLQVQCAAARYDYAERDQETGRYARAWNRVTSSDQEAEFENFTAPESRLCGPVQQRRPIFGKRALIDLLWRPFADGWIATVSLVNQMQCDPSDWNERNKMALFEVRLRCSIDSGEVGAYPRVDRSILSHEEQELELQYRNRHIYAIGHGAAVDWRLSEDRVSEIWTSFMPTVEVPQVTADVGGTETAVLGLGRLAACVADAGDAFARLDDFVNAYQAWVGQRGTEAESDGISAGERPAARRILARMEEAVARMQQKQQKGSVLVL